jgi:hypothetical protein
MIWKIVAHFFLYNPKQPDYNDNLSVTKCYQIVWPVIVNLSVFPPLKRVVQKFEPHDSYSNREGREAIFIHLLSSCLGQLVYVQATLLVYSLIWLLI